MITRSILLALCCVSAPLRLCAQSPWPTDIFAGQVGHVDRTQVVSCTPALRVVTADSIGPIRLGMSLAEFRRRCARAVYAWDFGDEGQESPAALIRIGPAEVMIDFTDTLSTSTVYGISTNDRRLRTADGIGPGVTVSTIIRRWGRVDYGSAECGLSMWSDARRGIGFTLELPEGWGCEETGAAAVGTMRVPPGTIAGGMFLYRPATTQGSPE